MKNKNGFTLVELLGVIVILGLVSTIGFAAYNRYLKYSQDKTFKMEEQNIAVDVQNAIIDCMQGNKIEFCKNHKDIASKEDEKVYLQELIDDNFSSKVKNPYNPNEQCNAVDSYVIVRKNRKSYDVCLICGDKKSDTCE